MRKCKAFATLHDLVSDFVEQAKMYAKVIVTEKPLSPSRKTLKPVQGLGFAGGQKYCVEKYFLP